MTNDGVGPRVVRAPRGSELNTLGWQQEGALRMLMNNLDPENAERPDDLVVYGGTGKAARSWEAFDAIVRTLKTLRSDETMLVQSGKPVGVFRTHEWAPRVLLANSNLRRSPLSDRSGALPLSATLVLLTNFPVMSPPKSVSPPTRSTLLSTS